MLPWWAAEEIQGHAEAQFEACSIDLKELTDISSGQIIMACHVQSFGATLRVGTSHRAEKEVISCN